MQLRRFFLVIGALAALCPALSAQRKARQDSLVTLISAKSASLLEMNGQRYDNTVRHRLEEIHRAMIDNE